MASGRPTISLYTGAGGMDYGFEAAGFETRVALEFDRDAAATLRHNRPWPVIEADICSTPSSEILRAGGLKVGEAALLIGGPPCQPFSKSGYWSSGDSKRLADPRARTLDEYMRVVRDALPETFVLENVHGISYSGKEEGMLLLQEWIEQINAETGASYVASWQVLNAVDYGVPQQRSRFFMVANREGRRFTFPLPTHGDPDATQPGLYDAGLRLRPLATTWDAIGDLRPQPVEDLAVRGRWAGLLPSIPEGENYLFHTDRRDGLPLFGWRRRYWSFLLKLAKNRPSWTIQAQPGPAVGPFHWDNRRLSVQEMARLQTFPDGIEFVGGRNSVQRQLGNAVPSLLAEVVGRAILEHFFDEPPTAPSLEVKPRRPIPEAEPVAEVPSEYLHLVGRHQAHPGTGLGYSRARTSKPAQIMRPRTSSSTAQQSRE